MSPPDPAALRGWRPDGVGLPDAVKDVLDDLASQGQAETVYLRLSLGDGSYPKWACESIAGLGQWWTGLASEVTCPDCLELVHS